MENLIESKQLYYCRGTVLRGTLVSINLANYELSNSNKIAIVK